MPTARELLEQADALMRRNRKRGKGRLDDVPTLTASLDRDATLAPTLVLAEAATLDAAEITLETEIPSSAALPDSPVDDDPMSLETLADVPVLTDVVVQAVAAMHAFAPLTPFAADRDIVARDAASDASDVGDAFPTSAAQAAAAAAVLSPPAVLEQEPSALLTPVSPPDAAPEVRAATAVVLDDEFILEIPPVVAEAGVPPPEDSPLGAVPAPAAPAPAGREWDALAEEIRAQVLQRLDLFTDTGLREQLGERLQPIVDRASAQLIETINRELGELVRGYVAEAIEREIESWRGRGS